MPSETVMVLNSTLLPPAASAPAAASRASSAMCMLQGVTLAQVEATPICGLAKSASLKPTARSMARDGACFSAIDHETRVLARDRVSAFVASLSRSIVGEIVRKRVRDYHLAITTGRASSIPSALGNSASQAVAVATRISRYRLRTHCASAPTGRPGPVLRVPGIQIHVQPVGCRGDEAFQEQRSDDRAGERARPTHCPGLRPCSRAHRRSRPTTAAARRDRPPPRRARATASSSVSSGDRPRAAPGRARRARRR